MNSQYSNREIDRMLGEIKEALERIEKQTIKHNGRMTRVEKTMLIAMTAIIVLLIVNGSQFVSFARALGGI